MAKFVATLDASKMQRFLKKTAGNFKNANKFMRAAYATFGFRDIIKHFTDQKGPRGRWERRADSTQFAYARTRQGFRKPPKGVARGAVSPTNKILVMTGKMRQSILPTNSRNKGRNRVVVFAADKKSGAHDRGDSSRNLPQREFMWLSGRAQEKMLGFVIEASLK